ncbi:MAG TPA: nuclear transport factor 2 family protein [Isosphaeraceae bacterium]
MGFREALDKHLEAIRARDLRSLAKTLPAEELTLVMSDGRVERTTRTFLDLHRDWFRQTSWSLDLKPISLVEAPEMGLATFCLDYSDASPEGGRTHQGSILTLAFALQDGEWVMVLDQNTPIKVPS